jgi:hypothetical protein
MGMFRYSRDGEPGFYEFVLFEEIAGSIMLRIRHFNRDFSGWEGQAASETVDFPLVAIEGNTAYFDGTTFHLTEEGKLEVGLNIETEEGVRYEKFDYRKVPLSPD